MPQATLQELWPEIRMLFREALSSSFHYAIASVNPDGSPHVTPIGSLILDRVEPKGFFLEKFTSRLPSNLESNQRVCIMAVNSSRRYWLSALLKGRFPTAPAVRLTGTVSERRPATHRERTLWLRRVRRMRWSRGHDLLWQDMAFARHIVFDGVERVNLGAMTRGTLNRGE